METNEKIITFLKDLDTVVDVNYFVDIEDIDFDNAFDSIYELLDDNGAFNIDIIYYSEAINYLRLNDASLKTSLEFASDLGYQINDLNSELLASILASENARNEFWYLRDEINNFFTDLKED